MANQGSSTALLLSLAIVAPVIAQAPPPAAPSWTGWAQCQISIQAPGYSHRETHLWKMTGAGTPNANMEIYPASWTVTGDGSLQRANGPTTVSAQWTVNGTLTNLTIGTTRHLDRITIQRWTNHGPARGGLTGTEVSTTNGVPRSRAVILDVQQWAFPGIETGTSSTRATGSNTMPFDGLRGPLNPPSGAVGTAACTWDFARGGVSPSAPPSSAVPAPTTPSPGTPVSGGAPPDGGGGAATADLTTVLVGSDPTQVAVVSWPANGTATYYATFRNGGPAAADGAVVRIPASAGLSKTSAACSASGGAQCPAGLTASQLESGVALPIWPSGGSVNIRFLAAVTGPAGTAVRVTATATAPPGATDPNPGNNSYNQTQSIVGAPSSTSGGGGSGATADLYVDGQSTPTPVVDTGVLIPIAFGNNGGAVTGAVVKVAASSGLLIGDVTCSIFNSGACLDSGSVPVARATSGFAIPSLPSGTGLIMVNGLVTAGSGGAVSVTVTITPPAGVTDPRPDNNTYTVTATAVAPAHAGGAAAGSGGHPAVATTGGGGGHLAIQPTADLSSFIYTSPVAWPANGNATYDVTVRNNGPQAADGAMITVPASPGLKKWMASCAQFRGPSWNVPIAQIESGFVIPTLPAGNFVECVISAIVTGAAGSDAALTVQATTPGGVEDPNPGNSAATHTLPIR